MKKHSNLFLSILISTLFLVGCGPVGQKIAKDTLSGDYEGTISFAYKTSNLNLGLQDFTDKHKCFVKVFSTPDSPSLVYAILKPEGGYYKPVNINIGGIQLRPNGASFNILSQQVNDQNTKYFIEGFPLFVDAEGNKADGAVDDKSNLEFSFTGNFPIPYQGKIVEMPCIVTCNLKKQ